MDKVRVDPRTPLAFDGARLGGRLGSRVRLVVEIHHKVLVGEVKDALLRPEPPLRLLLQVRVVLEKLVKRVGAFVIDESLE